MEMANSKYRLIKEKPIRMFGRTLYQVEALKDFGICFNYSDIFPEVYGTEFDTVINRFWVKEGDLGGYIESEDNLSCEGNAWVGPGAAVFEGATVSQDAYVHGGTSRIPTVSVRGNAKVCGSAEVKGSAQIRDQAIVNGFAVVDQYARVEDCACVSDGLIGGNTWILGDTFVSGDEVELNFDARPSRIESNGDLVKAINSVEKAKQKGSSLKIIK